jgi:phosphatidyl-myo-inositol dimannoside synthase
MNILVLATDAFGGYGGIAQYNRDFAEALGAMAQVRHVDLQVRLAAGAFGVLPAKVRQISPVSSRIGYTSLAAARALARRPDVIVCAHLFHGPLAHSLAQITGARLVSQVHGTEVWGQLKPQHRGPLAASDLILCVSRDTRRHVIRHAPSAAARALVVPNTVHEAFTPGDRAAARRRFGLGAERVVLTVARLDNRDGYKGHDRVIACLRDLQAQGGPPVTYLIAGEGDDQARLQRLAQAGGIADRVRFLGKVAFADLPDLYRAADLFALPSTGEGFGIAFLEAMACGAPAIGLNVGGAPDALADGELGWCVAPSDFPAAFAAALAAPRPEPQALSAAVQARFGKPAFNSLVAQAMAPLIAGRIQ